jgi:hypothetical protein
MDEGEGGLEATAETGGLVGATPPPYHDENFVNPLCIHVSTVACLLQVQLPTHACENVMSM